MMKNYYVEMANAIKDSDVRTVAAVMSAHVGEANAIRIEQLSDEAGISERQVRCILEQLVTDYGWAIGAHSSIPGRWIIASEEERWHVANELLSREEALRKRRRIIEQIKLPAKLEFEENPQQALF